MDKWVLKKMSEVAFEMYTSHGYPPEFLVEDLENGEYKESIFNLRKKWCEAHGVKIKRKA